MAKTQSPNLQDLLDASIAKQKSEDFMSKCHLLCVGAAKRFDKQNLTEEEVKVMETTLEEINKVILDILK